LNGHYKLRYSKFAGFALALIFIVGCAEVLPPPGGPEDKQSPYLLGATPENGAVNVDSGNSVTLFFSENVVKPRLGKSFFISPRQLEEPQIRWKSDRVIIELAEDFDPEVTYVISAASAIADLRGNRIDSGLTVAFTRSAKIDLGQLSGQVVKPSGKPVSGLTVALFDPNIVAQSGYDSLYGDYVTETDAEGLFFMKYLAAGDYSLIVFEDKDRDGFFESTSESYAVPDRPVMVSDEARMETLRMTLVAQDTSRAEILSVSSSPDGLVRVRLSRNISLERLNANPGLATMINDANISLRYPALTFQEYENDSASNLNLWFGPLPASTYELRIGGGLGIDVIQFDDVAIGETEDSRSPEILRLEPESDAPAMQAELDLVLYFSEPIDTTGMTSQTFALVNSETSESLPVQYTWRTPLVLSLQPDGLEAGQGYRLDITEFELSDLAGNRLGDSLRSHTFGTVNEEDLGSISGVVLVVVAGRENDPVEMNIENVDNHARYELRVETGEFVVALPAGKYLLSGFVDSDSNGSAGYGSLDPFAYAETQAVFADTIAVRARFETAGIEFIIE
jgi:hypothetical protein